MKRESNKSAVTLTILILGCGVAHAAEPAHQDGSAAHSVPQCLKHTAVRTCEATRHGNKRSAEATVHAVKRGGQASGHGIKTGAHAVDRVVHHLAEEF
jgi:hypothetical protein